MQTSTIHCMHMHTILKTNVFPLRKSQGSGRFVFMGHRDSSLLHQKSVIAAIVMCCICIYLLAACGSRPGSGHALLGRAVLPTENRRGVTGGEICPATTMDGYYVCNNIVQYVDAHSGKTHPLCSQPGCSHADSVCEAWIGQVSSFTEYHNLIYAIVQEGDHGARFVRKDLTSGQVTTIDRWENSEDIVFQPYLSLVSDQMAVIVLSSFQHHMENGIIIPVEIRTLWLYSLETGEKKELFPGEAMNSYSILAMSSERMAVIFTPQDQQLLDQGEFVSKYGENASYGRYLHRMTAHELRLYRTGTTEYTVLASAGENGFIPSSDPHCVYGDLIVYQRGETLWLLNIRDGNTQELGQANGQINYWIMDGRVFRITQNQEYYCVGSDVEIRVDCIDPETGEVTALNNGGNRQRMEFSVQTEGGSFFVGYWNNGLYLIRKGDFYAELYQNARPIG